MSNKTPHITSPRAETAVTFGRYNTTTIAHMHTIEKITSTFERLSVGVIDSVAATRPAKLPAEFIDFCDLADEQHLRTTLTLSERQQLLKLSIADSGLADVVTVVPIPRPEYDAEAFTSRFPTATHQLVFPRPKEGQTAPFDRLRDSVLPNILGRSILGMEVDFTLHTSEIRRAAEGRPDEWRAHMTPSAYQFFREIDGPTRINTPCAINE